MKQYTTIIFDCDGTILNTLDDLMDTMNYVLSRHNYPLRSYEEIRSFVGNGLAKLVDRSIPTLNPPISENEKAAMLQEFKAYYADHCNDKTAPYPGIYELLKTLKEKGYKLAVVSNKVQEGITALTNQYFKDYFTVAIGETPDRTRKPEPDMVLAALEALQSTPEEAIYIGDSEVDLATAKNSGILPITVTWGFRDENMLRELGANYMAKEPKEVLTLLKELIKE